MQISRAWLQNFFMAPLPDAAALADALTFHAFEIDGIEHVGSDAVLDVKITPNRGHDCLSHRGIAAELSAILNLPLNVEKDPFAHVPVLAPTTDAVSVSLDTPLAKRYIAGVMRNVKVGPSPAWLKESLEAVGQRSINNVVDATNFVMFNTGQPLHAFDTAKLGSTALSVRTAREGETLEALDGKTYTLTPAMVVIATGETAVGIAGVKGGMPASVDETTTDIILESANFDGVSVRTTAATLKLRTDASARFEQVISPELAAYGMAQVAALITQIAGGEIVGFVDVYPVETKRASVTVSRSHVSALLGIELSAAEVGNAFTRLGFTYEEKEDVFTVTPPFQRIDIALPEDLIEEVVRIIGYERIPAVPLPLAEKPASINARFYAAEEAREALVAQGYSEVFTSAFAETGERAVTNKLGGDRPYLRSSLIPGLKDALAKNIPQKDLLGLAEVKLFEIGTVWQDGIERVMLGTISEKQAAEERDVAPITADQYDALPLSVAVRYEAFSKYPYIVRDIALWVPEGTTPDTVAACITAHAGSLLVAHRIFDTFAKNGRVSYAFRLIFQSFERTLENSEVDRVMQTISAALTAQSYEIR